MDLLASPPTPDTPLTGEQKAWIAGYLAGLKARPDVTAPAGGEELLVLYGTQSGNAEWVAVQVQRLAAPRGLVCRVADMDEVDIADIAAARKILIVVSTYGEGDMPDNAADLWRAVASNDAPASTASRSPCADSAIPATTASVRPPSISTPASPNSARGASSHAPNVTSTSRRRSTRGCRAHSINSPGSPHLPHRR